MYVASATYYFIMVKPNKYRNVRVKTEDGLSFDSKREYERYLVLSEMQKEGIISDLKTHVSFVLVPAIRQTSEVVLKSGKVKQKESVVQRPITYTCDFTYINSDGEYIVEDVKISKHLLPKEYMLKKKMMLYFHGIKITEYYGNSKKR